MSTNWNHITHFSQTLTQRVGKKLIDDFGAATPEEKNDGSLVTKSDVWADNALGDAIAKEFPEHGILTEEGSQTFPDREWCWVIDPIDGTTNFARGIPVWGISLGLLYRGTPVFGLVHFPPIQQTFHGFWNGETGLEVPSGAYFNGEPIRVSPDEPSDNHLFSFCSRSVSWVKHPFPCKIRMVGAATYNLLTVASGICLGAAEATPKVWDIAAVYAIVRAAGAAWVFLDGESVFPLVEHQDYLKRPVPSLVVSREALVEVFRRQISPE
ncbi:inositol monophosphatase family protein [Baaleninema simplex]|uniref:inositol monophosphatase family protein n=1 Tax=Baaleninema simplex TaxID=2862350 RepID=UPI000345A146|nr:inositol monophosphatase family protein [Baaleninema simplex]